MNDFIVRLYEPLAKTIFQPNTCRSNPLSSKAEARKRTLRRRVQGMLSILVSISSHLLSWLVADRLKGLYASAKRESSIASGTIGTNFLPRSETCA